MFGLSDPAPIEFPEQKRESLLNFLQGDNDKETRLKVDSAFEEATLYNIEGVFVLDWENGLTEEYTCKNNIWVRIGINNNLYKMKIEQIKKDNQKDAPFYQGMTKEEALNGVIKYLEDSGSPVELVDLKESTLYVFGYVLVVCFTDDTTLEFIRHSSSGWLSVGGDNPYYKELIQLESPAKKKELEGKEAFEDIEQRYLGSIKDAMHLAYLKDIKEHNPNRYKCHIEREFENMVSRKNKQDFGHHICQISAEKMRKEAKELLDKVDNDITNSLDKSGEDIECPNDGLLALIKQMYPNAKCIWLGESELEPELTPQDLIQAAKDELISRVSGQYRCSPRTRKQESKLNAGWAGCIQYLEFLTEIQEKPNNVK